MQIQGPSGIPKSGGSQQ